MESILQSNVGVTVPVLVAVMVYAMLRAFQSAYVLVRDGLLQWQGRRILGELQQQVASGRRTSFELFIQHGVHHLQLRDPMRARSFFEAATQAHPMSPHGYYGQGLAWRESRYFAGAMQEQALVSALERDPDHIDARLLLIELYVQSGLFEKAREQYRHLPENRRRDIFVQALDDPEIPHGVSHASTEDQACGAVGVSGHKEARGNASFRANTPKPGSTLRFRRATRQEKFCLAVLDVVLVTLLSLSCVIQELLPIGLYLLVLLIPYHSLLFWDISIDEDGLDVRTIRSHRRFRWTDVTDLVEAREGGFFIQARDRALYVSRHWGDYPRLLQTIKHHLYQRGWVPLLRSYSRSRWLRPLIG